MPVGRNSVHGPANAPVYDPAPIHGVRRVYLTTRFFDLPPFHQAGFVTSSGVLALSTGYPVPIPLILHSATVTLRVAGGGSVTFAININGVATETRVVFTEGLSEYPLEIMLEPGDIVTSEVTATTGNPQDFLVVLRVEIVECPPYTWMYRIDSEPSDGDIIPNLGTAPGADLVANNIGVEQWTISAAGGVSSPVGEVCDPSLPWTALIRVGDFAGAYASVPGPAENASIGGDWVTPGGANNGLWGFGEATGGPTGFTVFATWSGLAGSGELNLGSSPISNRTFMISATSPAIGGTVTDYRAVAIQGGVVSALSLSGHLYSPGPGFVPFIQHARALFSQGVNGMGLWRERIHSDAEFLAKLAELESA